MAIRISSVLLSLLVLLSSQFLLSSRQAEAAGVTYYVDTSVADTTPASQTPDCVDYDATSFACGSGTDSVYATVADINAGSFGPGDSILFRKGQTWTGEIVVPSSGAVDDPISFGTFGEGASPIIDCAGNDHCLNITGKSYITVTGLTLTGAAIDGISLNASTISSDPDPLIDEGEVIEGFENAADWTLAGGGAAISADTANKTESAGSLKLSGNQGQILYMTKAVDLDLSGDGSFTIDLYSDIYHSARSFRLYFSSVTDFSKQFYVDITLGTRLLPNGHWNRIVLSKSDFKNTGGESWDNRMVRMKLGTFIGGGGAVPFLWMDNLKFGYKAKAVALISFDDGYRNVLSLAKPILDANGQKATIFVNRSLLLLGHPNWLDETDIRGLYEAGWDISNHTYSHTSLPGISASALDHEINDMYDYLFTTLGFERSAKFFAYPAGHYDDTVVAKVAENHKYARTVDDGKYDPHPNGTDNDYLYMGEYGLTLGTASIQAAIDTTIARHGLLNLFGHQVGTGGVSVADLTTVSNYLKSRESEIATLTYSEYFSMMNPSPPDVIIGENSTGININQNVIRDSGRYGIGINSTGDYEIGHNAIEGSGKAAIGILETKDSDLYSIKSDDI